MDIDQEKVLKVFDRYADSIRVRSQKWTFYRESRWGDRRIKKYLKYFALPISPEEVIALMDTTIFRTGKEGLLFTYSGIVIKEVLNKLYYIRYDQIERAELLEVRDEYYNLETSVWIHFKDGTKKQIFDYYFNKYSFVEFINAVINPVDDYKSLDE